MTPRTSAEARADLLAGVAFFDDPAPSRRACAWCGLELAPGPEPTSHGICDRCAGAFRAEMIFKAAALATDAEAGSSGSEA